MQKIAQYAQRTLRINQTKHMRSPFLHTLEYYRFVGGGQSLPDFLVSKRPVS